MQRATLVAVVALAIPCFSQGVGQIPRFNDEGVVTLPATTGGDSASEETSPAGGARGVGDETCWEDGSANVLGADVTGNGTSITFTNENGETAGPVSGLRGANGGMARSNPHAPSFPDGSKARVRGGIVQTKQPGGSWQNSTRTSCSSPSTDITGILGRVGSGGTMDVGIDNGTVGQH